MRGLFILLFTTALLLQSHGQLYPDSERNVDTRITDLISQMTLQEKIGQMTQAERGSVEASGLWDIKNYFLGSVLSGGGSVPSPNTAESWVAIYNNMQEKALSTRLAIPIIYGIDAVHGHNNLYGAVIFPHNIGLGCTRNPGLVNTCAEITALEVRATGLNWTFSPCIAVPQNEFWGRTYEGFGESPGLVDSMCVAAISGYQGDDLSTDNTILACAKHFAGDGGTMNGIDQGNTILPEDSLRVIHLPPYFSAVDAGVGSVMISFSSWNNVKCHANSALINGMLKDEMGFEGIVLSDWKGIDQLNGDFKAAIKTAINAGIDMAMQPDNYIQFIDFLTQLVNEGEVSTERIDDAVARILEAKIQLGLFENPYADLALVDTVGCPTHRAVAQKAVRESLVLLKNDGILPLSKVNGDILVAGAKANDIGAMCGGWTISWQGGLGAITEGTTILEGITNAVGNERVVFTGNPNQVPDADYAVVVVGENPYAEGSGDIFGTGGSGFILSDEDKLMIEAVKDAGIPMVVILLSGRPLDIRDELVDANAFIAAWLPGTEGGPGIADVIFGDYLPTGKLSHTWPESFNDVPINIFRNNAGKEALFPYGYGLSFPTSVDGELANNMDLAVFPNPVNDYLVIRSESIKDATITITDLLGKPVIRKQENLSNRIIIHVGHLRAGIYILTVDNNGSRINKRIVKR